MATVHNSEASPEVRKSADIELTEKELHCRLRRHQTHQTTAEKDPATPHASHAGFFILRRPFSRL
jgi:hypothetical protein